MTFTKIPGILAVVAGLALFGVSGCVIADRHHGYGGGYYGSYGNGYNDGHGGYHQGGYGHGRSSRH
ncbi:MAG: hypothetical protein QOK29_524 [Rhodospirillaceae bacterium]|jgi:hypothetical protein|nr:hypothetical protein [Rhodospirillaceae bacterium]